MRDDLGIDIAEISRWMRGIATKAVAPNAHDSTYAGTFAGTPTTIDTISEPNTTYPARFDRRADAIDAAAGEDGQIGGPCNRFLTKQRSLHRSTVPAG